MKLEDQVCSLDIAKKLKEIGIKQESLFAYNKQKFGEYILGNHPDFIGKKDDFYSAFTASELMEMTPQKIDTQENEPFNFFIFNLSIFHSYNLGKNPSLKREYTIHYYCDTRAFANAKDPFYSSILYKPTCDENLSNLLSKNIIHLFEKGHIKIYE